MPHDRYSSDEIQRRGEEIYSRSIRDRVEVTENTGRILVLDIETGDYEIAEDGLSAGRRLRTRHPDAAMLCLRIGYNGVYALGGEIVPNKQA